MEGVHLVPNDGLYDRKGFYKIRIVLLFLCRFEGSSIRKTSLNAKFVCSLHSKKLPNFLEYFGQ